MLIAQKIRQLQNRLDAYQAVMDRFPDTYTIENGNTQYLVSPMVMKTSEDVEFLAPTYSDNGTYNTCVYADVIVREEKLRVYGIELMRGDFRHQLFIVINGKMHCHDYHNTMKADKITNAAIRKMDTYVVDFIKEHQMKVEKSKLPENIKGLMAFL